MSAIDVDRRFHDLIGQHPPLGWRPDITARGTACDPARRPPMRSRDLP